MKWKDLERWERVTAVAVGGVVIYGGYRAGKKLIEGIEERKAIRDYAKSRIETGDGTTINLNQIAFDIYDAFYLQTGSDWFWAREDEEQAMRALMSIPIESAKVLVPRVAKLYNEIDGDNFYIDFREYLSNEQYTKIKPWLV